EVLKRLQAQPPPVVEEVAAGLEAWMLERRQQRDKVADWQRLLRLADQVDASERRREVRRLLAGDQLQRERIVGELSKVLLPWSALSGPVIGAGGRRLARQAAGLDSRQEPVLGV